MHHESESSRREAPRLSEEQLQNVVTSLGGAAAERVYSQSPEVSVVARTHHSKFGNYVDEIEAQPRANKQIAEPTVFYSHGAGWAHEAPTVKQIATFGRRAFSYVHRGERQVDKDFIFDTHEGTSEIVGKRGLRRKVRSARRVIPKQLIREAATFSGLLEERAERGDAEPIDAIFQSASVGPGMLAVNGAPEKFRNVVLAFPSGFEHQKGVSKKMAKEAMTKQRQRRREGENFIPRTKGRLFTAAHALRQQVRSSGFFANAAALRYNSSVPSLLNQVKSRENAPGVTIVAGLDDKIFPIERILNRLESSSDVDRIMLVPGGHAIDGRSEVLETILDQFPVMEANKNSAKPLAPLIERIEFPENISKRRYRRIEKLANKLDQKSAIDDSFEQAA